MFIFGLKKTQVWVTITLLCLSICPISGYPRHEDFKDEQAGKESLNSEEDHEVVQDEDRASSEEEYYLEEVAGEENDKKECVQKWGECSAKQDTGTHKCCEQFSCQDLVCMEKKVKST